MRQALDHISHTRVMYHAVHKSGLFREYTIQDVAVPYSGAEELIDFVDRDFGCYPPWICPLTADYQESQINTSAWAYRAMED